MALSQLRLLFVIGPSGAGKTTLASALATRTAATVFHGGAKLRALAERDPGGVVAERLRRGEPVPPDSFLALVEKEATDLCRSLVIFDGFPRTCEHVESLPKLARLMQLDDLRRGAVAVELVVSPTAAVQRLAARFECGVCGEVRATAFICSRCAEEAGPRHEGVDAETTVRQQLGEIDALRPALAAACRLFPVDASYASHHIASQLLLSLSTSDP